MDKWKEEKIGQERVNAKFLGEGEGSIKYKLKHKKEEDKNAEEVLDKLGETSLFKKYVRSIYAMEAYNPEIATCLKDTWKEGKLGEENKPYLDIDKVQEYVSKFMNADKTDIRDGCKIYIKPKYNPNLVLTENILWGAKIKKLVENILAEKKIKFANCKYNYHDDIYRTVCPHSGSAIVPILDECEDREHDDCLASAGKCRWEPDPGACKKVIDTTVVYKDGRTIIQPVKVGEERPPLELRTRSEEETDKRRKERRRIGRGGVEMNMPGLREEEDVKNKILNILDKQKSDLEEQLPMAEAELKEIQQREKGRTINTHPRSGGSKIRKRRTRKRKHQKGDKRSHKQKIYKKRRTRKKPRRTRKKPRRTRKKPRRNTQRKPRRKR